MDQTVSIFNKYALQYALKYMDVSLYATSLDVVCDHLKRNAEVLELACGPGNITKYLLQKRPDLKILGTDLAPNMLAIAKENNPAAEFGLMDCRDVGKIQNKFDAIVCGFCLPYLTKTEALKLIDDASACLKNNGSIYISTMEDDYSKSGVERSGEGVEMMMYYHESGYLLSALEKCGFKLAHVERTEYQHNGKKVTDLLIVGFKQDLF